ncbi:hypothetical protein ACFSX9_04660 [Flavobacterium ardleyense]|uniref:Uncharacterized protein n=1 Tax=Flavobacterium ardleyense TaxID=2038737 RepID=A0ABW5Z6D7_9FLAO
MGFFSFLFKPRKVLPKLPLEDNVKFDSIESDDTVEIAEELTLLKNPDSEIIDIFAKDYGDDKGKVDSSAHDFIDSNLEITDFLSVENEVVEIESDSVPVNLTMSIDNDIIDEDEREHREEWSKKIRPKFNPKTNLSLRFQCEQDLVKSKIKIKVVNKEISATYWSKINDSIWLENLEGEKLPAENTSYPSDLIKTIRAMYSGHELEVKSITKEGKFCNLEIGKVDKE